MRKNNADEIGYMPEERTLPGAKETSFKKQRSRASMKSERNPELNEEDAAMLAREKEMKEVVDKIDNEEDKQIAELKKKLEKEGFFKRLAPYNKPVINIILGFIVSCVQGCIFPVFGIFITKFLFALMNPYKDQLRKDCDAWGLYMFICALISLCTTFT